MHAHHAQNMTQQNQHKQHVPQQNHNLPQVQNSQQHHNAHQAQQQQQQQLRTIKSEPVDHIYGQNKSPEVEGSSDSDNDVKDGIKTEGPNAGLPEDYQGFVQHVKARILNKIIFSEYFEYAMEAPKSLKQKEGEPTMSYINKGNCDFPRNRKISPGSGSSISVRARACVPSQIRVGRS